MEAIKTPIRSDPHRPTAFARAPDLELDCRTHGAGAPAMKVIMDEARHLAAGQLLSVRIEFMPSLLCRMMAGRGFRPWFEPAEDGQWQVLFLREPRRR